MLLQRCWKHQTGSSSLGIRSRWYSVPSRYGISLDRPVQSYISKSRDPYINLSIEHFLLQKSHPDSAILFLYVNRPSIIIGRNQNPWLEVNLRLLKAAREGVSGRGLETEPSGLGDVDLVRRRSGGGTVFHDEGNVNWTVISPSASFTRDKHAEMVVRALRSCGVSRSRVNERHDIVLDQGQAGFDGEWGPQEDTHSTPWQVNDASGPRPLKVSGSAYKLTRARALHHGTALLSSPNLNVIPHYLRSPAKPFIKGRGVESVNSPVGNILLENDRFIENVQRQFAEMYRREDKAQYLGEECLEIGEVQKGYNELKSPEWTFSQTPQFTFSSAPVESLADDGSSASNEIFHLNVKNGSITESKVQIKGLNVENGENLRQVLENRNLHKIRDWTAIFQDAGLDSSESHDLATWIQNMLLVPTVE